MLAFRYRSSNINCYNILTLTAKYQVKAGLEIRPFLQSGTAKICAGMVKLVISHSDELANLKPS